MIMSEFNLYKWIKISFINLLIVAVLGVIMRYKIGFDFPYFDQKHLQHAHSHFAFTGWISQTLMLFMIELIHKFISEKRLSNYQSILYFNIISAYGMLVSFATQGYAFFSIIFSTLSIIIAFVFTFFYLKDIQKIASIKTKNWFTAALLFNAISTLGTFALVFMMATKNIPQHPYLASIYWFLHFQYNGWFFFAISGLFYQYVYQNFPNVIIDKNIFWLFVISCIPAYGLSTLWLDLPIWIYVIIVFAALAQFVAWIKALIDLYKINFMNATFSNSFIKVLLIIITIALSIKLSLQLGSVIPSLSQLAFGFRPIVIAYLHLVLLAFTSIFLITYACLINAVELNKYMIMGLIVFCLGVFFNELILAIQGVASFSYTLIPKTNESLFLISLVMLIGISIIVVNLLFKRKVIS